MSTVSLETCSKGHLHPSRTLHLRSRCPTTSDCMVSKILKKHRQRGRELREVPRTTRMGPLISRVAGSSRGKSREHLTSILPGRIKASSRSSFLLVMPTTRTFWRFTSPSILLRIWFMRPGQASNESSGRTRLGGKNGSYETREPHAGHHDQAIARVGRHRESDGTLSRS